MATLTGQAVQSSYKDLLQVSNSNAGIDGTKRIVEDGEGTASVLELSTTAVNVASGFELNDIAAQTGSLLKHEVGGLEFDLSAITTDEFIGGASSGVMAIRTAAQVRTSLSLVIGTDVQAFDAQLDDIAALAFTNGNIIVGDGANWVAESGATARTSLGVTIGTDVQAWDAQLDDIAALAFTNGNFIVGDGSNWVAESGATVRASLGLTTGTSSGNVPLVGTASATEALAGLAEIATQTEVDAGTDDTRLLTPKKIADMTGNLTTADFVSAEQTVTADTVLDVAHSLGAVPTLVQVILRCKTTEHGYAANDEVEWTTDTRGTDDGTTIARDATNVTIVQGVQIVIHSQSTLNHVAITVGNWRWIVRAWA